MDIIRAFNEIHEIDKHIDLVQREKYKTQFCKSELVDEDRLERLDDLLTELNERRKYLWNEVEGQIKK